jgi:hypothetical protein
MAEAAEYVGMTGKDRERSLLRRLRAQEKATGRPILRRFGGRAQGTRYAVTVPILRRWCPEFFASRADLPKAVSDAFEEVDGRILSIIQRQNAHGSVIRQHSELIKSMVRG